MTHVHYKFSSKLSYDTVVVDGPQITLRDLKRQIMGREKLRAGDCDLQITNAQNKEEYTDDEGSIPKGSSVIVRRIPIIGAKSSSNSKIRNVDRSNVQLHQGFGALKAMDDQNSSRALPFFAKMQMVNMAEADVSEEDKLKVLNNQSTNDSMNNHKNFGTVLPANYTCYRCGNTGHHIRNCPNTGDKNMEAPMRIKKSTGIPRSFMVEVDDPSIKGAMLTNCGRFAIPAIDAQAYAIGKKERPPFLSRERPESEDEEDPVPEELLCLICHDLLSDAVNIPCCVNSYCDDCIRTALLDSEEHVCPTCNQSDVSPDTLIANKFLRQAVDNFKKEQGSSKSLRRGCSISQSQNPTPMPSPVPNLPPLTMQIQPKKPLLPTSRQQDPLLHRFQAAETPPSSQVYAAPPKATRPASATHTLSTSLQPGQSHLEIPDESLNTEAEENTRDDSVAAVAPSVPVSPKDPAEAPSQLKPLVNLTSVVEQPAVSVTLQQPSSGPAPRHSGPSMCWESLSSSSARPTGGRNESNPQQLPPISYPATPPPLFPSPHFHTFLTAQQPLSTYPHGYPPTTPVWTLPNLQGAPIPSLCPSTSIPALIPKEWYRHQRKKERSPHRGSSHRHSSSRSNSKSSKSKTCRSYSRSSSRSRSRARSRSRSHDRIRHNSTYSRHKDRHSHSSRSYSYGYKRSPATSSSSSPRGGYHSKSPSNHRKNSPHSRHHHKKSTHSSSSSRRQGGHSQTETGGSGVNLAGYLYPQHANLCSDQELDRERYLRWKRDYKEWCDKYFSSYVGHFHQMPFPLLSLPPPQLGDREGSAEYSRANSDSCNQLQGRRPARIGCSPPSQSASDSRSPPSQSASDSRSPPSQSASDSRSPSSQSASDSRSPPSQSSCESRSTPSRSSSESRSTSSQLSSDSRSSPSQSSGDGRSTPSDDAAKPGAYKQGCTEKYSCITLTKGSEEVEPQEGSKDEKQLITKTSENLSSLKHDQKSMKKHMDGNEEESSSPDSADSTDGSGKDKRRHNTEPNACKESSPARESVQPSVKPDKCLDIDYERKRRDKRNLEMEKGQRRGKHSDSRQDVRRRHKEKPSREAGRVDADRYPGGSRASDSRSEKNRKRKGEEKLERSSVGTQSSKCQKTDIAEDPTSRKSESPNRFDRKKPSTENKKRRTFPLTERDIWEGSVKVKQQKKISININLQAKGKEEKTEIQDMSYIESVTREEEIEKAGNREEKKLNRGETDIEATGKESSSFTEEEKIKPDEGGARQKWEKATFRDDEAEVLEKVASEKKEENIELCHSALRSVEEEKEESKNQWDERDGMEASRGEEVSSEQDNNRSVRGGKEGQVMGELAAATWKGERTCKDNRGIPLGESNPKEEPMEGSHHGRPNTPVNDGSCEDHQEKKRVMKILEEYSQDRPTDKEDKLIQVPLSKLEKEASEEEERDKGVIKVQADAPAMFLPSPSVSVTAETTTNRESEDDERRERSVEMERDKARATERGRDKEREKPSTLSISNRSVAPSSGKERTDSTLCTDREGGERMEMDMKRRRDGERPRDRQKESKRSKERTREEEKGRHRERERGHSRTASAQKRNPPSSSHSYSYSTSHHTDRRDRQEGGDPGGNKSSSGPGVKFSGCRNRERNVTSNAIEPPDQSTQKSYRDTSLDSKFKDKEPPHYHHNHQDPSGNYRHQDKPAGTHHSPLCLSHIQGKERDSVPSGSELSKPRMRSPGQEFTQNRSRNQSKVEKVEGKLRHLMNEGKGRRENLETAAEREGGSRWKGKADESDRQTKWEGGRDLEEGERPSGGTSSASQGNDRDDERKEEKKKHKMHKREKRRAAPELLKKHKKKTSKRSRDGRAEESSGEVDDRTTLCSVMWS